MQKPISALLFVCLLVSLAVVLILDPKIPHYRSTYDSRASDREVEQWRKDLQEWAKSPTYDSFTLDEGEQDPLGKPDFARDYLFGKYRYIVRVQIRGDTIHYISWGTDDQEDGGAWYSVGEGKKLANGEWFSVWSCLDLSRGISNGGGAWFRFNRDMTRFKVRYYHDTVTNGESPIELGEAVAADSDDGEEMLEGRIPTDVSTFEAPEDNPYVLWGRVVDEAGNGIAEAAVKRRAAGKIETTTDAKGFFRLELDKVEALTLVTAGKLGFYNGVVTLEQGTAFKALGRGARSEKVALATITLKKMDRVDHRDYKWVSPDALSRHQYSPDKHMSCGNCHTRIHRHWKDSRHATTAVNPWTHAAFEKDARPSALAAGREEDECTPCHSPSLASGLESFHLSGRTLLDAKGVDRSGNHCDFCHKIEAVTLPEAPGMNGSIRLLRPDPNDASRPGEVKRVFGPLPDVSFLYMGAGYNPLFETGMLCASCHEHVDSRGFKGQGTYSEWRQTKYARPGEHYQECQDCHMPNYNKGRLIGDRPSSDSDLTSGELESGGVTQIARSGTRHRPLSETHKHSFIGTEDEEFLKRAVSMSVNSETTATGMKINVTLENIGAGHAIPTGHGLKRYVLAVFGRRGGELIAPNDAHLALEERAWEAQGATALVVLGRKFQGASPNRPGEVAQPATPGWSVPYWRALRETGDTRLRPDHPRPFSFEIEGADDVEVKLILRRASPPLLAEHGLMPVQGRIPRSLDKPAHRVGPSTALDTVVHTWRSR